MARKHRYTLTETQAVTALIALGAAYYSVPEIDLPRVKEALETFLLQSPQEVRERIDKLEDFPLTLVVLK